MPVGYDFNVAIKFDMNIICLPRKQIIIYTCVYPTV